MASDVENLSAQLDQHLREYHQRQNELDARDQEQDRKIFESKRYAKTIVDWQDKFDKKTIENTRAIEGLAVLYGRQADALEKLVDGFSDMKKVIVKIAKKLGVDR